MATLTAVGLAGLANSNGDSSLMVLARSKYGSSLRSIQVSLSNPMRASKTQTIATSFILLMFEMITCQTAQTMNSWVGHIEGVTALLELQNLGAWKNTTHIRGLLQVCYLIVVGCIIRRIRVPQAIIEWIQNSQKLQSDTDVLPAYLLFNIICRITELHASCSNNGAKNPTNIISACIGFDNDLSSWVVGLPGVWTYSTSTLKEPHECYGTKYHVYGNPWFACIWGYYRFCRIMVHQTVLHCLNNFPSSVSPAIPTATAGYGLQRKRSRTILVHMCLDMCASIPYQLGFHESETLDYSSLLIPKPSGVFSLLGLIQGLVCAADAFLELVRAWLPKTLELIDKRLGIRQAFILRQFIGDLLLLTQSTHGTKSLA
ncbi:hypothetical protein NA57DRAFT_76200 [Rhizodiscina lignyota]|uniref:Uncharacterized protein n=1 Tax=Rhizodiscina lignyota TaxID=1504668 RepID=A0A9P4M5R3_9PEZI|nr:hypothetical protein NA57DRAFT_76200 [Rhizodiscina lignyota]